MRKARSIQKLILKSTAARLLAVRQVSQLNAGKKTAGIDGEKDLTFEERFSLCEELLRHGSNWHHQGLREVPIPKKNGIRILKIPTVCPYCTSILESLGIFCLTPLLVYGKAKVSKPKTLGNERNNRGSSPHEQGGKHHWVKSDRFKVARGIG